jgi:NAD(P)H-dependent FMN reductase
MLEPLTAGVRLIRHPCARDTQKTSTPTPHITSTSSLSVSVRTHHLIEAAESLSALTHQLKLWVVLSDEDAKKKRKDDELERVSKELEEARREVAELLAADGGKT